MFCSSQEVWHWTVKAPPNLRAGGEGETCFQVLSSCFRARTDAGWIPRLTEWDRLNREWPAGAASSFWVSQDERGMRVKWGNKIWICDGSLQHVNEYSIQVGPFKLPKMTKRGPMLYHAAGRSFSAQNPNFTFDKICIRFRTVLSPETKGNCWVERRAESPSEQLEDHWWSQISRTAMSRTSEPPRPSKWDTLPSFPYRHFCPMLLNWPPADSASVIHSILSVKGKIHLKESKLQVHVVCWCVNESSWITESEPDYRLIFRSSSLVLPSDASKQV